VTASMPDANVAVVKEAAHEQMADR
jgi:hypothetical protein